MAEWIQSFWESGVATGLPRSARISGPYHAYVPDPLEGRTVRIGGELSRRIADAERAIRSLNGPDAHVLAAVSRFLLRSEAIASSRIEGVAPSARNVALAELGRDERVTGVSQQAQLVANNLTVVQEASTRLAESTEVTVADVESLHRALLPDQAELHGIRNVQNWIGGSDFNPLQADFVPPPPGDVPALMADLVGYINGAAHSPLVQAALVHAQFETIHPFTDGNGRVGRALVHTVLTRRGLTPTAVLPVSMVLSTFRESYLDGLTGYRYDGEPDTADAVPGVSAWVEFFVAAALAAAEQSRSVLEDITALQRDWERRLATDRISRGVRPRPRIDSATSQILGILPSAPVLTSRTVQRVLGVSPKASLEALAELTTAGILQTRRISPSATAYLAGELLDLITFAERRLASAKFDTRASSPRPPVPARPANL